MDDSLVLFIMFAIGLLILVAEIFIPSHGVLTVVGLGCLIFGIVKTFQVHGNTAGVGAIAACLVIWPIMALLAVKYWYRTPMGKYLAPPNPTLTSADRGLETDELVPYIGARGLTVSPLRPVGVCQFGDRRLSCIAEMGIIDPQKEVMGIGVRSGQLVVTPAPSSA